MAHIIAGANTTAQWYQDDFPGGTVFPRLDKAVLHTTETEGFPGYSGGASAPNVTWHPRLGQVRQHFPNNVSSRALRDPSSTPVRENRDRVWQVEIVAYSDKKLGDSVGGLWIGDLTDAHYTQLARILRQLGAEEGLPLTSTVTWKEGATSFYSGVRLSSAAFDAYRGILGHVHVSGNTHWDPGGFRWSKLAPKLRPSPPPTEEEPTVSSWDDLVPDPAQAEFTGGTDTTSTRDQLLRFARVDARQANVRAMDLAIQVAELEAKVDQILAALQQPPPA